MLLLPGEPVVDRDGIDDAVVVDEVVEACAVEVDVCDAIDVEEERVVVDGVDREVVGAADVDVERFRAGVVVACLAVVVGTVRGVVIDGVVGAVFAGSGAGRTTM
jgi:hypothetical protein